MLVGSFSLSNCIRDRISCGENGTNPSNHFYPIYCKTSYMIENKPAISCSNKTIINTTKVRGLHFPQQRY